MKRDITELPSDVQAQIRGLEDLPDDQIDTTDAPEILDWSDARRGVFYRPVKQQITLRLDADIIAWFKARARNGRGYQTDINGRSASTSTGRPVRQDSLIGDACDGVTRNLRESR